MTQWAAQLSLERPLDERLTLALGLGAALGGILTVDGVEHALQPGPIASLSASYVARREAGALPFVLLSASLGGSALRDADQRSFTALDLRVGASAGWTFFDRLTPYATARAFGGPVFWTIAGEDVVGTDVSHVAAGAGASLRLPAGLDLFAELLPLGEQAFTAGAGASF